MAHALLPQPDDDLPLRLALTRSPWDRLVRVHGQVVDHQDREHDHDERPDRERGDDADLSDRRERRDEMPAQRAHS
jgi:hypothetical protein